MAVYDEKTLAPLRQVYAELLLFIDKNTVLGKTDTTHQNYDSEALYLNQAFRYLADVDNFNNGYKNRILFDPTRCDERHNALFHKGAIETKKKFHPDPIVRKDFGKISKKFNELGIDKIVHDLFNNPPKNARRYALSQTELNKKRDSTKFGNLETIL